MSERVPNPKAAIEIVEEYASSECIGEFGEVTEIEERDAGWDVEFETHTFSDVYTHHIHITKSVGNVVSHDRSGRFD